MSTLPRVFIFSVVEKYRGMKNVVENFIKLLGNVIFRNFLPIVLNI